MNIHHRITTLADELQEQHIVISGGHPTDHEGFVQPQDQDLADALRTINYAVLVLSRLAYRIARDGAAEKGDPSA